MYHSTRSKEEVSGIDALLNGLALDGGLYVLDQFPCLNYKDYYEASYITLASKIISSFFNEFSYSEIEKEVKEAYSSFDIEEVVQLKKTKDVYFLELFHGPTLAFKDIALMILPRLMKLAKLKKRDSRRRTILTATSGDTGGAALNGFANVEGMNVIVLYPNQSVSNIQEQQMLSYQSQNSKVYAVQGNFDDCQTLVKEFFLKNSDLDLSSANSINIGRLIPQIVYYFYCYILLVKQKEIVEDETVDFIVPTGNFGNVLAALFAKFMGVPIRKLIIASNENDVLVEFFTKGVYNANRKFHKTNSPSMDILISSNLERFLYYACGKDSNQVFKLMKALNKTKRYRYKNPFPFIEAYKTDSIQTNLYIKQVYEKYGYLIDPHTAVAYGAYQQVKSEKVKQIIVSTASPFKFPKTIVEAFGLTAQNELECLKDTFHLMIPKQLQFNPKEKICLKKEDVFPTIQKVIECLK